MAKAQDRFDLDGRPPSIPKEPKTSWPRWSRDSSTITCEVRGSSLGTRHDRPKLISDGHLPSPQRRGCNRPGHPNGDCRLTVFRPSPIAAFYEETLDFRRLELDGGELAFGTGPGRALVELRGDRSAPPRDRRAGFFPPSDPAPRLVRPRPCAGARSLRPVSRSTAPLTTWSAKRSTYPIPTATESRSTATVRATNGRRPYWPAPDGDPPSICAASRASLTRPTGPQAHAPAETTIGHVHLQVSELGSGRVLHAGVLGFDVMVRRQATRERCSWRRRWLSPPLGPEHLAERHLGRSCQALLGLRSYEILLRRGRARAGDCTPQRRGAANRD